MPQPFGSEDSTTLAMMPAFTPAGGIGAALATLDPPWVVLRQGAFSPLDGQRGQIYGGIYIVLHPAKGIALADLAPAEPETALPQLRSLLCGVRLSEYALDQVPLVAVSLAQAGLAAAEDRIAEAFARAAPCTIQDGSWIELAGKALASRFPELMHVKRAEFETPAPESQAAEFSPIGVNPKEPESIGLLGFLNPSNHVKHWENPSLTIPALLSGSLCAGRSLFRRVHRATMTIAASSLALLGRSTHAGRAVAGRVWQSKAAEDLASTVRALPKRLMNTAQILLVDACQSAAALGSASLALLARSVRAGRAMTGRHDQSSTANSGSGVRERLVRFPYDAAAACYRSVFERLRATYAKIVAGWRVLRDAKSVDDGKGPLETDALGSKAGATLIAIETTHLPKPRQRTASRSQRARLKLRLNSQSALRLVTRVKSLIIRLLPTDGWISGGTRWRWREATAIAILQTTVATFAFFDLRDAADQASQPRAKVVDRHVGRPLEATTILPARAATGSPLVLARPTVEALPVEPQQARVSATLEQAAKRTDPTHAATASRHVKKHKARVVEHLGARNFANAEGASIARERRAKRRALLKARTFSPYDGPEYEYANRQIQ